MNTNDLCTYAEADAGFSAHYTNFGIMIMRYGKIFGEVANETELHEQLHDYITNTK